MARRSENEKLEVLTRCLEREVGRRGAHRNVADVLRLATSIDEVLRDPNLMGVLERVAKGIGRPRGDLKSDRSIRARRSLELEPKYQDLLEDLERLSVRRRTSAGDGESPDARPRTPPYADLMAQALEEAEADELGERLPVPPPILGGYEDGAIWVEAEPWVPLPLVTAYYRSLQELLGTSTRQVVHSSSLELYIWVKRRRRGSNADETWMETTTAWNRGHPARRYTSGTNLHKDFHRIQRSIEGARPVFEDLREEALRIEAREGGRGEPARA